MSGSYRTSPVGFHKIEFTTASTTWNIVHQLDTLYPIVDCWIDIGGSSYRKAIPKSLTAGTSGLVVVEWSTAQSGYVIIG